METSQGRLKNAAQCLFGCALAVLAGACSSDANSDSTGGSKQESAIWPSNASVMVVMNEGGGFTAPPPDGSTCAAGEVLYTLTVATRNFAWEECKASGTEPYTRTSGERVLSQAEVDGLVDAVRKVTLSTRTGCGADKSSVSLSVTAPDGEHHYLDDFYACNKAGTYVSGLDELQQAAASLVK